MRFFVNDLNRNEKFSKKFEEKSILQNSTIYDIEFEWNDHWGYLFFLRDFQSLLFEFFEILKESFFFVKFFRNKNCHENFQAQKNPKRIISWKLERSVRIHYELEHKGTLENNILILRIWTEKLQRILFSKDFFPRFSKKNFSFFFFEFFWEKKKFRNFLFFGIFFLQQKRPSNFFLKFIIIVLEFKNLIFQNKKSISQIFWFLKNQT